MNNEFLQSQSVSQITLFEKQWVVYHKDKLFRVDITRCSEVNDRFIGQAMHLSKASNVTKVMDCTNKEPCRHYSYFFQLAVPADFNYFQLVIGLTYAVVTDAGR